MTPASKACPSSSSSSTDSESASSALESPSVSPAWPPASGPRPRVADFEARGESSRPLLRLEVERGSVVLRDAVFPARFLPAVFRTGRAFVRRGGFLLTALFLARVVVLFL